MIKKIIRIQNVAKFHDFNCIGDVELNPLSLIYGENGKGKSTLAAIFRSLASGNPSHITAKRTIGTNQSQYIKIQFGDGITEFINKSWTQTCPNLIVFDSYYVNLNVFSGDRVDHTHRKNLYYLLIGEQCVQLAKDIDQLAILIRDLGQQIKEEEEKIIQRIIGNFNLPDFIALKNRDDIDRQISNQEVLIASLKRSLEIQTTSSLTPIMLPVFDSDHFEKQLQETIENMISETEAKFKHHCQTLSKDGETWIKEGVDFTHKTKNVCPFCGQPLANSDLSKIYSDYFNDSYLSLKKEINQAIADLEKAFSTDILIQIQTKIAENSSRSIFWKQYIDEEFPDLEFQSLKKVWEELHNDARNCLIDKSKAPLEKISMSLGLKQSIKSYTALTTRVYAYDGRIEDLNIKISSMKEKIKEQSIDKSEAHLNILYNTRLRFDSDMQALCNRYVSLTKEKNKKISEKEAKRLQLSEMTTKIIGQYQKTLNGFLLNFGTEFQIKETKTSFQGGRPSANYCLEVNGECIPLGSEETLDKPGFKTTLSDGEKSTLAFAFFLAQLFQDPELNKKVIVIDDPITSLDENRRVCTKHEILKIVNIAEQVIVLSHDPYFLKSIGEEYKNPKTLWIKRSGKTSVVIEEWDIEAATQSSYIKDYWKLKKYFIEGKGDPRDVVRCIRPLLEGYLRFCFPDEFLPNEWLGQFIEKIAASKESVPLGKMKDRIDDLICINDYSKRFHHQFDPDAATNLEKITEGELSPWVKRTLEFVKSG
jgi:wobble nucleotide-excising tRNase